MKMSEIKAALPLLKDRIQPYKDMGFYIVSLGKTADIALTLLRIPHYAMPHPSPINRQLNNQQFIDSKINGLIKYLQT